MRDRTAFLLILVVVVAVLFGAQGLGYLLLALLLLPVLLVAGVVVFLLVLRSRARRSLTAWERHMGDTFQQPPPGRGPGSGGDVIDVQPTDIREAEPDDPDRRSGQRP